MTKKLICLLLAAFLGVSLIALFAACRNHEQTPDASAPESSTASAAVSPPAAVPSDPSAPTESPSASAQATDVFSLELPREDSTE